MVQVLPEVGGVHFSYDKTCIIPSRNRESREETQNDYHKLLRVDNVEEKHRGSG